ncbi:Epi-isozizaene 5-monooxygenase/(E)-beta-farnesene synthase [Streptomyces sulfonofaciens]|uniref:Epi-isozizaene 5-monooxygenase/(E)-beta-farnesene synthase n=1 Tax=Streptomyces sulfonofaciens TaxID=68272 RepID=A0A919GBY6_9ACTN|nr:cytochrome P450 [Streptomyces sulfonofaciens]GHH81695.1 Epi-isozizaene 5-monooxygenase/(E)-beta-farnesene synthase [Streptomyces sulfonofaciens]
MTVEPTLREPVEAERRQPPLAGGAVPLLGHAWKLVRDPLAFLAGLRDHGDLVRLRLGPRTVYAVCAPELVGQLLKSPDYEVGGPLWDTMEVLLGKGVATSNGAVHRRQRRMMQPAFRPERIADYAAVMEEEARAMVARWQPGSTIDIGAEMFRTSVRIVSRSLLEVDSIAQKAEHISEALGTVFEGLYRRMVLSVGPLYRVPTPANRRFARALADLHGLVDEILAERHASGTRPADLITVLLEATDETGAPLGDREIHDHVVSLVVAGAENVASTLAWTLSLLTEHRTHENRLADEVNGVTGGEPVGFADIGRLSFTRNVITEAMRIRPAPWILTRRTVTETALGGYTIPANADIVYSTYAMQRDPRSFTRHLEFDPDRWLPERAGDVEQAAMIPFGTGNRKCPGDHFSMAEFAIVLATVVPKWRLTPVAGTDTSSKIGITLHPKRLLLRADPR